jgi:hypothetical protein
VIHNSEGKKMNVIEKESNHECWIVMDQFKTTVLGYVYKSGALVRPDGAVEFYSSPDEAYAAI